MAARSQKSLPTCDFLVSEGADMQAGTVDTEWGGPQVILQT